MLGGPRLELGLIDRFKLNGHANAAVVEDLRTRNGERGRVDPDDSSPTDRAS